MCSFLSVVNFIYRPHGQQSEKTRSAKQLRIRKSSHVQVLWTFQISIQQCSEMERAMVVFVSNIAVMLSRQVNKLRLQVTLHCFWCVFNYCGCCIVCSDLDPIYAPHWSVRVRVADNPQCLLGNPCQILFYSLSKLWNSLIHAFAWHRVYDFIQRSREGWHQRSRSLGQLGRALPVSTFGEINDATCWPNSPESRSMLQQYQEHSIRERKKDREVHSN